MRRANRVSGQQKALLGVAQFVKCILQIGHEQSLTKL
jgi:hypothetical protein